MEFKEALKKVQSSKVKENMIIVDMSYDKKLVLPYNQGLALLSALEHAEQMTENYSEKKKTITGVSPKEIKFTVMSRNEYEQIKIAMLLNVSLEDVKLYELEIA
jgi:hypothetical protein